MFLLLLIVSIQYFQEFLGHFFYNESLFIDIHELGRRIHTGKTSWRLRNKRYPVTDQVTEFVQTLVSRVVCVTTALWIYNLQLPCRGKTRVLLQDTLSTRVTHPWIHQEWERTIRDRQDRERRPKPRPQCMLGGVEACWCWGLGG